MLNQSILVGRIVREPEVKELESGNKVTNITLAVQRSYKNVNGEYDTDFISCVLWKGIAEATSEYCKKGDLIGVRGHIQTRSVTYPDETKHNVVEVIAERVTFLSTKNKENKEN
ncbi:MAG: single-stranded DNA-binding protein [Bacilli bacterium]